MRRLIWAAALAATLATPAVTQDAPTIDLRTAARIALETGDLRTADALSSVILSQNPGDADALLIRSIVARATGQTDTAAASAAAAYRTAETDGQKFDAAMLAGEAAARQNRFTSAQIWLRRADQYAPQQAKDTVAQAYRQVTARNPLSVRFSFGFTPSSNVNNGAETTTIEIGGLPFSLGDGEQELGGYEATAGVSLSYRLSASKTQQTVALADLFGKKVWLNSEAKEQAPDVEGSDFDYAAIVLGLRHSRLFWPDLGPTHLTALLGQSWSGGPRQATWRELQALQVVSQSETSALRFGITVRDEDRAGEPINASQALGLSANWTKSQEAGGVLSLGASMKSTWSDSATVDNLALGVSASQSLPDWGAIRPRISLQAETRDYRKWASTPGGRRDNSLVLRLEAVWPEASYFGFSPKVSLSARRVLSDVDIYDRKSLSLGLTAVSRF